MSEKKDPRLAGAGQGPGEEVNLLEEFRKDAPGFGTAQARMGVDRGDYPRAGGAGRGAEAGAPGPEGGPGRGRAAGPDGGAEAVPAWQVVSGRAPGAGPAREQRDA